MRKVLLAFGTFAGLLLASHLEAQAVEPDTPLIDLTSGIADHAFVDGEFGEVGGATCGAQ